MKQLKTILFTLPFALAAVGCSQDELLPDGGKGTGASGGMHEVEVTFNMGTSGGLQTRSISRPVISSDDWQRVTNVRIYVFKAESADAGDAAYYYQPDINDGKGYLYVSNFADTKKDWEENDVWGDDSTEKENEYYTYSAKLELGPGYYKFLAIGRDDIDEEHLDNLQDLTMTIPEWNYNDYSSDIQEILEERFLESKTSKPNFSDIKWNDKTTLEKASINTKQDQCSELFSGTSPVCPITDGVQGFSTNITMNRAVAGFLMYVQNIPTAKEAIADVLTYDDREEEYTPIIEKGKSYAIERIAILSPTSIDFGITLNKRETTGKGSENTNLAKYLIAFDADTISQVTELKGIFLSPQQANKGNAKKDWIIDYNDDKEDDEDFSKSLYLVYFTSLQHQTSIIPIWWKPIKIVSSSGDYTLPEGEDEYNYSIKANHFYSFGKKNYEDGIDEPIDLSDNNLVITVNPDWDWKGDLEWAD